MSQLPTDRTIFQNAWVVDDLMSATEKWIKFYGIGPFHVREHLKLDDIQYRGQPAELDISVAIAQAGPVQIELIQQFNKGPSAYRDHVAEGESGFHHVCIYSHDFEADKAYFEGAGYATATQGQVGGGALKFAYFDTRPDFGVFMEVVTPTEAFRARGEMIKQVAADWDGSDPIRISTPDGGYETP